MQGDHKRDSGGWANRLKSGQLSMRDAILGAPIASGFAALELSKSPDLQPIRTEIVIGDVLAGFLVIGLMVLLERYKLLPPLKR